jgi:opacity protein-like surface antigen
MSPVTHAATPIDGWYSSLFGGYMYLPNNVDTTHNAITYTNVGYQTGYNAGGNFGYKSNPMRYEAELTYFNANINYFSENNVRQNNAGNYNNGILGMANIYYDFPGFIAPSLEPFLGIGIGYAWLNVQLNNLSSGTDYRITSSAFAYQATAGVTYNFAENYAANISYRYLATPRVFDLGHMFQTNFANVGITYRFDDAKYK